MVGMRIEIDTEDHVGPALKYDAAHVGHKILPGIFFSLAVGRMIGQTVGRGIADERGHQFVFGGVVNMPVSGPCVAVAEEDDVVLLHTAACQHVESLPHAVHAAVIVVAVGDEHHGYAAAVFFVFLENAAEDIQIVVLVGDDDHDVPPGVQGGLA